MVTLEKYFKALANQKRIDLYSFLLENGECSMDYLNEKFKLPYETIFRNLSILRTTGFVSSRIYKSKVLFEADAEANKITEYLAVLIHRKSTKNTCGH